LSERKNLYIIFGHIHKQLDML